MTRRSWTGALLALCTCLGLASCVLPIIAGTGMVTGALVATDRRTSGIVLEDQGIPLRIGNRISAKYGNDAHVNVTSFNRIVLLTGEVRNDEIRAGIEEIAKTAENVRSVVNETAVLPFSAYADRANDTYLADKIRARYITDGHFQATIVATVVERHEAFLMGLVTPAEADEATRVARETSGITRVVRVFEYVDPSTLPPPAAAPDKPQPDIK